MYKLLPWITRGKVGNMAVKIYTIEKILADLNKGNTKNLWIEAQGVYSLTGSAIDQEKLLINPTGESLVLKAFINKETAEMRFFLAKWLDVPETDKLP